MRKRRPQVRTITQRYLRYTFEGGTIRLPMVAVRLRGGERSLRTTALVDSGATASFVPPELVEVLELEPEEPSSASGAGGAFDTRLLGLTIEVLKGTHPAAVFDGEVHVPVEAGRVPYVVLGRDTIFLAYDITFRERRGMTVLRKPRR